MAALSDRISTVEELAMNLAGGLLDPQVKNVEHRHEKRKAIHAALVAAIETLASLAYSADSYLTLVNLMTATSPEEEPEATGPPDTLASRGEAQISALNAKTEARQGSLERLQH